MNKQQFQRLDQYFQSNDLRGGEDYLTSLLSDATTQKDFPMMLSVINELGGILRVTGRLAESEKLYCVALDLLPQLNLIDSAAHGTTVLNYAGVVAEQGRHQKALELYRETERIYDKLGIQDEYQRAALANNISHMLEKLGRTDEALLYATESLRRINCLQGHEVEKATSYATLAARQLNAGLETEAHDNLMESDKIFSGLPGHPHPHYAGTLNALGQWSVQQGRTNEAEAYYQQALEILETTQGKNQAYRQIQENLKNLDAGPSMVHQVRKTGMELARRLFLDAGQTMIKEQYPAYEKQMAIGLVGEGSECFGFDDRFSETHDFGPGFCIWLPDDVHRQIGGALQTSYDRLVQRNSIRRKETAEGRGRVGVHSIPAFFRHYIGVEGAPATAVDWFKAPETSYATVVNGEVFADHLGVFSGIRNMLDAFYPEDVLLKKVAARFAVMAQAGQYNYPRCVARGDRQAAYLSCDEFIRATASLVFLLNRKYRPFYKWTFRAMESLPQGAGIRSALIELTTLSDDAAGSAKKIVLMEEICGKVLKETNSNGWTRSESTFMNDHCADLMNRISNPSIAGLPVMYDVL